MSCQDKPLSPNSRNRKQEAGARGGESTRAREPRERPLLNLTGGHFSAITPGLPSHYLPQGMYGRSRSTILENNGSKYLGGRLT